MKIIEYEFKSEFKAAVIRKIRNYRKRGATFKEIAEKLNKEGVETFRGKGGWYAQSVYNTLYKRKLIP